MSEYEKQAKEFLASCNAVMNITYIGREIPSHWKGETKPHNKYCFTIQTPKGSYSSYFWDSLQNTEISEMTTRQYAEKKYKIQYECLRPHERRKVAEELPKKKAEAKPTEYDILACLEKYGYECFSDFCNCYGGNTDSISDRNTFLACQEEYAGLRRIFSEEQMEKMREIQ